jgi:hypothetical protein
MSIRLSNSTGSRLPCLFVITLFVFGATLLAGDSFNSLAVSAATSHDLDVQRSAQFFQTGYRATARPSDQLLTVAARFDIQIISKRLQESVTSSSSITITAANFSCCDWCDLQYERCINHGGDPESCDNLWCACMNQQQCGICPIC